jgi:hypothetical protein
MGTDVRWSFYILSTILDAGHDAQGTGANAERFGFLP